MVEFDQRFAYKLKVLQSRIGLGPQTWLSDVQAQHRPLLCSVRERSMVVQAKVAFEPNHAVGHGLVLSALGKLR